MLKDNRTFIPLAYRIVCYFRGWKFSRKAGRNPDATYATMGIWLVQTIFP